MGGGIKINVEGCDILAEGLHNISAIKYGKVAQLTVSNIFYRAMAPGGTPMDTGELRLSRSMDFKEDSAIFGYEAEYAPHVEYGHRTRDGGYVMGQHYLQRNVETERPEYIRKLKEELQNVAKG